MSSANSTPPADDIAAIKSLITSGYQGAVNRHDAVAYANLYMDDVLWAPPNAPDAKSKAGIQAAIQGFFDKFSFQVELTPDEVEVMKVDPLGIEACQPSLGFDTCGGVAFLGLF